MVNSRTKGRERLKMFFDMSRVMRKYAYRNKHFQIAAQTGMIEVACLAHTIINLEVFSFFNKVLVCLYRVYACLPECRLMHLCMPLCIFPMTGFYIV